MPESPRPLPDPRPADWRERLVDYRRKALDGPELRRRAATALVLVDPTDGAAPEILFIERAQRAGDPWSGQVSFPGGHADPSDPDLVATARRESYEELGLTLGDPLTILDDRPVHTGPHTVVTPHVFVVTARPELRLDPREVNRAIFVELAELVAPTRRTIYRWERDGARFRYPAITLDERSILWGLTYRSVANFVQILGHDLPERVDERGDERKEP
ncbi:MAG: CoA pyrophosphatase [Planctomycetes bacterium]|nr:CoA pyrophosphatase [Planctomycetota bacterium]